MNKIETIRMMNDEFRRSLIGGKLVITRGVETLKYRKKRLFDLVREYENFSIENDPYGEHDFGSVVYQNSKYFWKIDYYDRSLQKGSEDPSNSRITVRVLTIMLAEEY